MLGGMVRKLPGLLGLVLLLLLVSAPSAFAVETIAAQNVEVVPFEESMSVFWEEEKPEEVKEFTLHYRHKPWKCETEGKTASGTETWGRWYNQKYIPGEETAWDIGPNYEVEGSEEFPLPRVEYNAGCEGNVILEYEVRIWAWDYDGKSHSSDTSHTNEIILPD